MIDDPAPPRPPRGAALDGLTAEDLDPYAVAELTERIERLEREIARVRATLARKTGDRAKADALFSFGAPGAP